jgi:hypothetical protein
MEPEGSLPRIQERATCPCPEPDPTSPPSHPIPWRYIFILTLHLSMVLPSVFFPSGFPTQTLYAPQRSPILATCPAHLILLDLITRTILSEECLSLSSSLCCSKTCSNVEFCEQWLTALRMHRDPDTRRFWRTFHTDMCASYVRRIFANLEHNR